MIFSGVRTSIVKIPYIFVSFRGVVRTPCLPPLDPPMLIIVNSAFPGKIEYLVASHLCLHYLRVYIICMNKIFNIFGQRETTLAATLRSHAKS